MFPSTAMGILIAAMGMSGVAVPSMQQPNSAPTRPAYSGPAMHEIHVDERCRLLPDPAYRVQGKKQKTVKDPVICHLETVLNSAHREETVVGNQLLRGDVSISEQEYVLQNVMNEPVVFVVEQALPQGWVVDSDPQPVQLEGSTAIFRVNAQVGQVVRLHVGLRHTKPLATKIIPVTGSAS